MDLKLIQRLVRMMKRGEVTDLEIDDANAGLRVRLTRGGEAQAQAPVVHLMQGTAGPLSMPGGVAAPQAAGGAAPGAPEPPAGHTIASPLVGTFYRAPSPESPSFVEVGTHVEVDQVLCIVEAMKVMNEIKSEVAGEVLEVLADSGEPVEYGQPLFLIKI
jgi:acetyl-CoA carboxylase biotin carboxyl carrier protein